MIYDRLMYLFAGIFGLLGVPLVMLRDQGLAMMLGGFAMGSLGCLALTLGWAALARGEMGLQFTIIHRARRPRLFRAAVVLVFAAGAGVLVGAAWMILLNPLPGVAA